MNVRSTHMLPLVAATFFATSLVACSGHALRGGGTDAGSDAATPDAPTDGADADVVAADASFNPCPEFIEPAGGAIAAGAPCTSARECFHAAGESPVCGASNAADVQAKVQTCHRFVRVPGGAACVASRSATGVLAALSPEVNPGETWPAEAGVCDARDGLTCDWATHTCTPFAVLGAPCATRTCASDAHCGPTHVCEAPVAPGHTCDVGAELPGNSWCQASFHCDVATTVCAAKRAPGAECVLGFQCESGACKGGVCGSAAQCIP